MTRCRVSVRLPHLGACAWALLWCALAQAQAPVPALLDDLQAECNVTGQRRTLLSFYERTAGWNWKRNDGWARAYAAGPNAAVFSAAGNCESGDVVLPDHCCFYGVECCDREQCPPLAPYLDTSCNCTLGTVTALRLDNNNLTGPFFGTEDTSVAPGRMLTAAACSLKFIDVQHNQVTGTIPAAITRLTQLRVFNVAYNNLTGVLPNGMKNLKELRLLHLAMNNFSGPVPQDICDAESSDSLSELILASNPFVGTLNIFQCDNLILLNIIDCNITSFGSQGAVKVLPFLHLVFLSRNNLKGSRLLQNLSEVAPHLTALDLTNNNLTGQLPVSLSKLKLLASLVLSNNNFTGTLPNDLFAQLDGLSYLDLSYNQIRGQVPESLGAGKQLRYVDLSKNMLVGTLPHQFVKNVPVEAYVDMTSNAMSCCGKNFTLLSDDPFDWRYESYDYTADRLPTDLVFSDLCWTVDVNSGLCCPFLELGDTDAAFPLQWFLDPEYYLYDNCKCPQGLDFKKVLNEHNRYVATCEVPPRSPWYQRYFYIWIVLGLLFCVVVVALHWWLVVSSGSRPVLLQSLIDMRKRLKGAPLGGLVSVVVTDIEGYTGMMTQHPDIMMQALQIHNALIRQAKWNNYGTTVEQEGDSYTLVFHEPMDACKFCLQAQQLLEKQAWPEGLFDKVAVASTGSKRARFPAIFSSAHMQRVVSNLHASLRFRSQKKASGIRPPSHTKADSSPALRHPSTSQPPSAGDSKTTRGTRISDAGQGDPIHGLRVRMGIFTGFVPDGAGVAGSQVVDMAKVVSDGAAGGQVLMCGTTFQYVATMGKELGCVDETGMNFSQLGSWWRPWSLRKKQRHHQHQDQDATLLDMGSYVNCPKGTNLPTILTPQYVEELNSFFRSLRQRSPTSGQPTQQRALHLYQLLAPSLAVRGCYFGSKLSLKPEWKQLDRDFFSAPGALQVRHTRSGVPDFMTLPKVTMVFTSVESSKAYALRHRSRDARDTHAELLAVIRSCLLQVPGGYLLRSTDLDFKFMTAFKTPEAALTWCMAVQECAMYASWPQSALKYWAEEHGPEGQLLFRGPRLKMGLCEGFPKSLLPDFAGKADYLGDHVNQAARFMDAAAHGGQVACEQSLIEGVVNFWRRGTTVALHLERDTIDSSTDSHVPSHPHFGASVGVQDLHRGPHNGSELHPTVITSAPHPHEAAPRSVHRVSWDAANRGPPSNSLLPTLKEDDDAAEPSRAEPSREDPAGPGEGQEMEGGAGGGAPRPSTEGSSAQRGSSAKTIPGSALNPHRVSHSHADVSRSHADVAPLASVIEVEARHIGSFHFKGVRDSVAMVSVSHANLAGRRFPADAPGGKGSRATRREGVFTTMTIPVLPVINEYRAMYECLSGIASSRSFAALPSPTLHRNSSLGLSRVMSSAVSWVSKPSIPESRSRVFSRSQLQLREYNSAIVTATSHASGPRSTPELPCLQVHDRAEVSIEVDEANQAGIA